MSRARIYPWQRAFWSDARDGFRLGWVFGFNAAAVFTALSVVVLSDSWIAVFAMFYFVWLGWVLNPVNPPRTIDAHAAPTANPSAPTCLSLLEKNK